MYTENCTTIYSQASTEYFTLGTNNLKTDADIFIPIATFAAEKSKEYKIDWLHSEINFEKWMEVCLFNLFINSAKYLFAKVSSYCQYHINMNGNFE